MISVIVPVYNAASSIENCIGSILRQKYENFELIVINDGSTDDTDTICRRLKATDPRIIYHCKPNSGVGHTRNLGLEMASGEWIVFVDADDEVAPDYLSEFNVDQTYADLVICGIDFFDIKSKTILRTVSFDNHLYIGSDFSENIGNLLLIGYPTGKAYKKNIIDTYKLHFPTDISFHEDHVFVLDYLLSINSLETRKAVAYIYNIDYSAPTLSKMHHGWEKLHLSAEYMLERIFKIKAKYDLATENLHEALTFCYHPMIEAVYSLYGDGSIPNSIKKEWMKRFLKGEYPISTTYFPTSRNGILIKTLSGVLPIWGLHFLFTMINRYHNRRR